MGLILYNDYTEYVLHSGEKTKFKIDCDALSDEDIYNMGLILKDKLPAYNNVIGIPSGGSRLANVMDDLSIFNNTSPTLLVDDVYTTGSSMEKYKTLIDGPVIGAVLFARNEVPEWITPLFRM